VPRQVDMTGLTFGQRALPHRLVESNWLGGERARHRNDRRLLTPCIIISDLSELLLRGESTAKALFTSLARSLGIIL